MAPAFFLLVLKKDFKADTDKHCAADPLSPFVEIYPSPFPEKQAD
jgi:hypothetical protein